MVYHEQRLHELHTSGAAANFVLNGLPRKPGAPFADPCINDAGQATGNPRTYKAAAFQLDIKLNKAGWHFPAISYSFALGGCDTGTVGSKATRAVLLPREYKRLHHVPSH